MSDKYPIGTRAECERLVKDWGFQHVFTWSDGSNGYYSPHSHRGLTTHLIRRGTFTITYPDENANGEVKKETFGPGARIDVPAGKLHEVWIGEEGCEYVIGE
ncbi:hypothetical protein POX_g09005 [Penicillium oxalicum]|uniref:Cupin 2 conserved barrel domain-containing protein n=1 Tax=Penicillium oxalicum (strain 114-2 / CGMCC 5302) TaxID=933388 RepID=S8ALF6_PENO1|nr:hypothetical protein POX_g09005 [Penicillium oxalicum]EPS26693.1 hypothetical protein PDE_01631 [Penicillium oxalicum 114-2]KAI2786617.1 hypothetical protein POX_g09005 [Penicillium oxalicum]